MASEYKGLYVTFEGDSTALTAALGEINAAARKSQSALRSVQNALRLDPGSTRLLAAAMTEARGKVEATTRRVQTLRQAQDDLARSGDTTSAAYQRVSRELAQSEAYLMRDRKALVDATNAASGFGRASAHLEDFSTKAKGLSSSMASVGAGLTTGVTLPLAAVGAACVSSAVTIDTALTDVRKTTNLTEAQYQSLKESAIELSKTQPVDAATILSLEGLGAQLGWADDKLQGFAQVVSGLDIATDMNADQAATNLAQFANVTGMAQDKAENYASAIVGLGNNMATTESKISDMAMGMASAGTQAGMSQADILGVAAATASLGMESQAGGTAFSKTINEIGVQVSTNGKQLEQWAALAHMSVDQFKSAWQTDATGTFEAIIRGMGDAAASGQDLNVILGELGITEVRQSDFMRRLAGNSDLLTRAVSLSNSEWEKNTALSNEVGNRNQSLASKLDVLKNKVTAVAEQIGGPLADAALAAVDAAEPIAKTIEGAAKAFSSMSKEEQQGILKTVALAAAAGPLISIASKAVGLVGSVAGGLSTVVNGIGTFVNAARATDAVTKAAYQSAGGLAGKLGTLGWSAAGTAADVGGLAASVSLSEMALTGLVGGGIAIAVAGIVALGAYALQTQKRHDDLTASVEALDGAASDATSLGSYAGTVDSVGDSAQGASTSIEELTSSFNRHAQAIRQNDDSARETIGTLNSIERIIGESVGKTDLSASAQGRLTWALKQLSDQYGVTVSEADVANGTYTDQAGNVQDLTSYIHDLCEAKREEARVTALSADLNEAYAAQQKAVDALTQAKQEANDVWQRTYDQAMKETEAAKAAGQSQEEYARHCADAAASTGEVGQKVTDAENALDSANKTVDDLEKKMGMAESGAQGLADAIGQLGSKAVEALATAGISVDDLSTALQSAGVSAEQVAAIGGDVFASLVQSANGSVDALVQEIQTLNAIGIDPKTFTVNDDGTLSDEAGRVWDLNAQTIDGKHFTVNDDGTISIEGTNVDHLNAKDVANKDFVITDNGTAQQSSARVSSVSAQQVANKDFSVSDNGTAYAAQARVATVSSMWVNDKDFSVNARDNATSVISGIKNMLSSIPSVVTTVIKTVTGNAAGGVRLNAAGGVRLHADGAIYTGPTFISPHDVIGEDGAEYYDGTHIVPLTNRRYSQPFADLIADEVARSLDGQPQGVDGALVTAWLDANLGPVIAAYAPDPSTREMRRAMGLA